MDEQYLELGKQIDEAADSGDTEKLSQAVRDCERALATATGNGRVLLHYFMANAEAGVREVKRQANDTYQWTWEQPEATREILALRRAVNEPAFPEIDAVRRAQIHTNLANSLDHLGRTIDAIEHWDTAIRVIPNFAMALANRSRGLTYYAKNLYDPGHQEIYLSEAHRGFTEALSSEAFLDCVYPPSVFQAFQINRVAIEGLIDVDDVHNSLNKDDWSLGESEMEIAYRQWRLDHKLFLNPLNDLGAWPIGARDIFHLPSHTYACGEEFPRFMQYFDLMKEEYVGACALLFEAGHPGTPKYADGEILLLDHFDYAATGLHIQKLKAAFRIAYSIFDKIAVFISDFFQLERTPKSLNFRNVWYEPKKFKRLTTKLSDRENWALRGLFALSQDLFEDGFKATSSPDAKLLVELRNAAEHRLLCLHEFDHHDLVSTETLQRITVDEFSAKTLRMLRLARSALIYLSWAVKIEEQVKAEIRENNGENFVIPIHGIPLERL